MVLHSGGSAGDLSALDEPSPDVDSSPASAGTLSVGLHLRKYTCATLKLEHLKKEKLKTVRDSCPWAGMSPQARNAKLPPLSTSGEWTGKDGQRRAMPKPH